MPITVTISKRLDYLWGSEDDLAKLSDADLVRLVREDLVAFAEDAEITVARSSSLPFRGFSPVNRP